MLFKRTDEGWQRADEDSWYHEAIKSNLGCLGSLAGFCAFFGTLIAIGVGVLFHVNPLTIGIAFLIHYWHDILTIVCFLFIIGIAFDYKSWRDRQTSFQEALLNSLDALHRQLGVIEKVLQDESQLTKAGR